MHEGDTGEPYGRNFDSLSISEGCSYGAETGIRFGGVSCVGKYGMRVMSGQGAGR
jgi:hypothetical protein